MFNIYRHKSNFTVLKEKFPKYYIVRTREQECGISYTYYVFKHWYSLNAIAIIELNNNMNYKHIGGYERRVITNKETPEAVEIAKELDCPLIIKT